MKISIKREQSQASLSFAERKKFRPKVKQKRLLLLLALLMTAVTGAWAQATTTYKVKVNDGGKDAANWTANPAAATTTGVAKGTPVTLTYQGRLKVKAVTATTDAWLGDLSNIPATAFETDGKTVIVTDDMTLTGTLTQNCKIQIAPGATVTLDGVTINGNSVNDANCPWAGITCEGNATIVLHDDTENTVHGFYQGYPGILAGPSGTTLTIQGGSKGTGSLKASGRGAGAIGAGNNIACGNILISGGIIEAHSNGVAAGIGGGSNSAGSCGDIIITSGVTRVKAWKGSANALNIGKGSSSTCGTVTIGGTKYWENGAAVNDGDKYLKQSTLTYVNLAKLTADYEAQNGDMLTGTLAANVKIQIASGAKVTLDGVTITGNSVNDANCPWAGITCEGNATIVLNDGTTNTVHGFYQGYPGILAGPSGTTLTIRGGSKGTGSLKAYGNSAAAIGAGNNIACGNIFITGGDIEAQGNGVAAGIGGGSNAAGSCGNITITSGVTMVKAWKGGAAACSIGKGSSSTCGKVTIGGTEYASGITDSPYTYPPSN